MNCEHYLFWLSYALFSLLFETTITRECEFAFRLGWRCVYCVHRFVRCLWQCRIIMMIPRLRRERRRKMPEKPQQRTLASHQDSRRLRYGYGRFGGYTANVGLNPTQRHCLECLVAMIELVHVENCRLLKYIYCMFLSPSFTHSTHSLPQQMPTDDITWRLFFNYAYLSCRWLCHDIR